MVHTMKMTKIKNTITGVGKDVEKLKLSFLADGNVKECNYFRKLFLKMLNIKSQFVPAIPFLGRYPRHMKAYVHKRTCT